MKRTAGQLVYAVLVLLVSSIAVFYAIRLSGGDSSAAALPGTATPEFREEFRERLGLNEPIYQQYFTFIGKVVSGNPGTSLTNNAPLTKMLKIHGQNSLILGGAAFGLVFAIGIPLGMIASLRRNSWTDHGIMSFSTVAMAIPNFWLALLAVWLFASTLGWLPAAGCCSLKQLVLPAVVLAFEGIALTVRMTRSSMIESQNSDYVRTLRAGGISEWRITGKHVLRNAMIPIITRVATTLPFLITGSFLLERYFGIPGMGQFMVQAIFARDFMSVQGAVLLMALAVLFANLMTDLCYAWLDPRIRYDD